MINRIRRFVSDENVNMQDRMFVLTSLIVSICLFITVIIALLCGRGLIAIAVGIGSVSLLIAVYLGWKFKRISIAAKIVSTIIVLIVLPLVYYASGGVSSGAPMIFILAAFYISLLITGWYKVVLILLESVILTGGIYLEMAFVGFIKPPTPEMQHIAVFLMVVFISILISILVSYENRLLNLELFRSKEQREEIERLNRAQNQFFSSMSHEIRTPINTIIGLNEMILRENASDEINENAASIQSAGKMLLHLINDILDMSKFESGQMELTPVSYHVGDMLSDIVGMLWLRAKEKGLEFHVNVSPDVPDELVGDEVRIKQILINVLNNAIKYTSQGEVKLTIEANPISSLKSNLIFYVEDTGMGIKKESMPYLFTAFKRVDEEKNRHIEGTGLGLSIVKQFVDLMEGKITVNSVYTKGSTFIIEIPQQVASEKKIGVIDIEKRHSLNAREYYHRSFEAPNAKILVVDDTAANLLVVQKLLRDTLVKITAVTSGEAALKKTQEEKYDIILMDHLMPNMDGIECLHRIREQIGGFNKDTKIIALTANAGSESKALYAREGFDGYIVKPVTGSVLEAELRRLLPSELVTLTGTVDEIIEESLLWNSDHTKKNLVAITTESVADLPRSFVEKNHMQIIPHMVLSEEGLFRDGIEIEQNGLLNYMADPNKKVATRSPDISMHELFFAKALERANNVIHISISSKVAQSGYQAAMEASKTFENVFVIDSGHLSSGQGLMAMYATRLAENGKTVREIVRELEDAKKRVHTSFVVDNLDYLARNGQLSFKVANLIKSLMIRPVIVLKKGKMKVGRLYFGSRARAWEKYIKSCLDTVKTIDTRILFITHVGLTQAELEEIEKLVKTKVKFDTIYFQKASPAIAVNCGPGAFGLLFMTLD
ncbi:MAG: DegV family EDD domain-containing protein [Lachnospiraceae bacterium]|nr:DegV family EDD domain-containing protein [Lachnospiraceae bacterium]